MAIWKDYFVWEAGTEASETGKVLREESIEDACAAYLCLKDKTIPGSMHSGYNVYAIPLSNAKNRRVSLTVKRGRR